MRKFINYGKQWIDEADISAVVEVLQSDFLTQGPKVKKFEDIICEYTGAEYCVAVSNGTAALHLAVLSLGIEEGKEGITTPNTFIATANSMIYNGLKPVFADIREDTYCLDINEVKKKINNNSSLLVPVHFAGQVCEMPELQKIAKDNNLRIIEDAAHAIGSRYADGSRVGNCRYSDLTTFSFHPVKTITCGEGGAITTNDQELYEKLLLLRNHGIERNKSKFKINPSSQSYAATSNSTFERTWYHEMQVLGYNYRLTDIQAALGVSQMSKLNRFIERRREIIKCYNKAFKDIEWLKIPYEREGLFSAFHLYVVQIDFNKIGKTREIVMHELRENGIGTQVHYIPVHTQPYYQENYGFGWGDQPKAEKYYLNALSIPLYPLMTDDDVEFVIAKVRGLKSE